MIDSTTAKAMPETNPFNYDHPSTINNINSGIQYKFSFPNGFGASVVRHNFSYGGDQGLWELAVLDADGSLTYETPITDDVIGYLSEADVHETLDRIAALEAVK